MGKKFLDANGLSAFFTKLKGLFVSKDDMVNSQSDWDDTDSNSLSYIKNKPSSLPANGGNADTVNGHSVNTDVPPDAKFTDTIYTHPVTSGNKHIPSGGSSGQILKWSSDGTAAWGTSPGNYVKSSSAPSDTNVLWVDTANGGVVKYHNGTSWVATKAVWG